MIQGQDMDAHMRYDAANLRILNPVRNRGEWMPARQLHETRIIHDLSERDLWLAW